VNALVPYRRADLRRGKRSVVEFAAGGVAADVRVERVDRRNRCSWYAIRLASAHTGVTSRLVGVRRGGDVEELGTVEVASGAMGSARFAVTTPRSGAYRAMYLEVLSDQLLLRVEAPRPPAGRGLRPLKLGAVLVGIGVAACCVGAVPISLNHQANRAVAAPVAAVPLAVAPKAIVLSAPARILSFAARRDAAPGGGETVLASYLAVAERGTIALLDPSGTIISTATFSRVGTVRLRVPPAYRLLPMTAQITVHKGDSKAVSSVALAPNAVPTPSPSPSPDALADDIGVPGEAVTPVDSASSGSGGIVTVEGNAVAGHPLRLRFEPQPAAMQVELEDETGVTLAETDVAPRATRAALPLPVATVRTSYLLALHYTHNGGDETVIRTVVAAPSHQL